MVKPYCETCGKHNSECNCRPKTMVQILRDVSLIQAYGCRFCLHVGSIAILFGSVKNGRGPRLEICTLFHWFRWSKGYRE